MDRESYRKLIYIISLIVLLSFTFSPWQAAGENGVSGPTVSLSPNEEKMKEISERQKEILQRLFAQQQKIGAMEKETEETGREIEALKEQTAGLQKSLAEAEKAYGQKKEDLKQLLQAYQKMGPGSYLDIILASNDLPDFLRRLNILREISGSSGRLVGQLRGNLDEQTAAKAKLAGELASLNGKQAQFQTSLAQEQQLKKDLEKYLISLAAERDSYQMYLAYLNNNWTDLKPAFAQAVKGLSGFMARGDLPAEGFKITYGFWKAKASITDRAINMIIAGDSAFPPMTFHFRQGKVEITMPENNLVLEGNFVIRGGDAVIFQAGGGSFYGLPLETGALNELFQQGDLVLNLKPALGNYTIDSLEIRDGYLELTVSL